MEGGKDWKTINISVFLLISGAESASSVCSTVVIMAASADPTLPDPPTFLMLSEGRPGRPDRVFLCCRRAIYTPPPPPPPDSTPPSSSSSSQSCSDSDFRMFTASASDNDEDILMVTLNQDNRDTSIHNLRQPQLVYKYSSETLCFCRLDRMLFSLHFKASASAGNKSLGVTFVECCGFETNEPVCKESCVVTFHSCGLGDGGNAWMFALPAPEVEPKVLADLKLGKDMADDEHAVLVLGLGYGRCRAVAVHRKSGGAVSQVVDLKDYESKFDALMDLRRAEEENEPCKLDDLKSRFLAEDVRDVVWFDDGMLVLMETGRIWQYQKSPDGVTDGIKKVVRTALPDLGGGGGVRLMGLSHDLKRAAAMTADGFLLKFAVPFVVEGDFPRKKQRQPDGRLEEAMAESQIVAEIAANMRRLDEINRDRAEKEALVEQLRLATVVGAGRKEEGGELLSLRCSVAQTATLGGSTEAALCLEVKNESKFVFRGECWCVGVAVGKESHSSLATCREARLPSEFRPGQAWTTRVPLPREHLSLKRADVDVGCRLIFSCRGGVLRGRDAALAAGVRHCRISVLDFLTVTSVGASSALIGGVNDFEEEDLEATLRRVLDEKADDADGDKEESRFTSFSMLLPVELMTAMSYKPFFADLRKLVVEGDPSDSFVAGCSLFGRPVEVGVDFTGDATISLRVTCSHRPSLLALKNELQKTRAELKGAKNQGSVVLLDKGIVMEARRLREELEVVSDDETEENAAKAERCYRQLGTKVLAKLP